MKYYIETVNEKGGISYDFYEKEEFYSKLEEFCLDRNNNYDDLVRELCRHRRCEICVSGTNSSYKTHYLFEVEDCICDIADHINENANLTYTKSLEIAIDIYMGLQFNGNIKSVEKIK